MAKKSKTAAAAYEVGRGKPPRSTQFKPGQSGNPGGRRKGSLNFKSILRAVSESEIELSENGRKRKVSIIEAVLFRQVQDALRGEPRAANSFLDRCERYLTQEIEDTSELPEDDLALLERALSRAPRERRLADRPPPAVDAGAEAAEDGLFGAEEADRD